MDFVPKPFNEKRLYQALEKVSVQSTRDEEPKEMKFLSIVKRGNRQLIELSRLKYIKGAGVYTEIYLKDGTTGKSIQVQDTQD